VLISLAASTPFTGEVLVNLSSSLPANVDSYARVAEIIDADDARRSLGRERFRAYRERGIMPETHSLGA
jgi:DNA polymerase III subunit chi